MIRMDKHTLNALFSGSLSLLLLGCLSVFLSFTPMYRPWWFNGAALIVVVEGFLFILALSCIKVKDRPQLRCIITQKGNV